MAIVIESSTHAYGTYLGTGNNYSISKPSGTVSGDLLIGIICKNANSSSDFPAGWTELCDLIGADYTRMGVWWKTAGGSEPSTYAITSGSSSDSSTRLHRISGRDTAIAIIYSETSPTAPTSDYLYTPTVTPSQYSMCLSSIICGARPSSTPTFSYGNWNQTSVFEHNDNGGHVSCWGYQEMSSGVATGQNRIYVPGVGSTGGQTINITIAGISRRIFIT